MRTRPRAMVLSGRCLVVVAMLLAATTALGARRHQAGSDAITDILQRELAALHEKAKFPGGMIGYAIGSASSPGNPAQGEASAADAPPHDADERSGSVVIGAAFRETGAPLTTEHRLCAGSIGKTFCAAILLMLVDEGRADLDARIETWLGGEPWFERLPNARAITLRQLLNHTSGVPEHVQSAAFRTDLVKDPDRVWRPAELVAYVLDRPALFAPGDGWSYADTNYILVGMIIEKIAAQPFYELVRERLLEPLRLDGIVPQNRRDIPMLTGGYVRPGGDLLVIDGDNMAPKGVYRINPHFEWTGGGFATTARDLARWTRRHFRGDLLKPETKKAMLDAVDARQLGPGERYGLGVQVRSSPCGPVHGHGGFFPGYLAETAYYPDLDLALTIQVNASTISRDLNPRTLRATLDLCAKAIAALDRR